MTSSNSSINLVDLDFDTIKSNLKTYLKSQPRFLDYDFEGSNMNVLLDILSYNTFHNAFYLNMVAAESYLDSAQLRNSVVSHAKELNYVPRSARSARAVVNIDFGANTNVVTIPKGTSFTTKIGYNLFDFVTDRETVHFSSNNYFSVRDLQIYEGNIYTDQFIVNYENPVQRFVISSADVDTRSLTISVIEDNSGNILNYTEASTTLDLTELSQIYFLQAAEQGKYEVVFGDGIIGRKPKDNALIRIEYRTTKKTDGNGGTKFVLNKSFATFTTSPVVTTVAVSRGGAEAESIESIKFYAPRYYQTQERAVNTSDYEIIMRQRFPEINAISAYGGEEVSPPQFGKVFIAVDISDIEGLPQSKVAEFYSFLKPRSPLSIEPLFVDPDFLYYSINSKVQYDINSTSLTTDQIKSKVVNQIITYNDTYLNDFKTAFRYSKFIRSIDDVEDASIISNDTDVVVYKKIYPPVNTKYSEIINFNIPLTLEGAELSKQYSIADTVAIYSTNFTYSGDTVFISDDGNGKIRLVKSSVDKNIVILDNIGSVNYETGTVSITNLQIESMGITSNHIKLYAVPRNKDFETSKNVILTLEPTELNINVTGIRETTNGTQSRQRA